jgi:protein-S-isoprenylcysteine O-methyltransferase Ste14
MENLIKYGLFIYLIINFALTFVLPSYRIWKAKGIFAITFSNKDSAHDYIGSVFKTLLVVTLLIGAINAFYTEGVKYLLPIWYLDILYLRVQGSMILLVALVWIMVAQYQMADSWRIGIDETHKTKLVTEGMFSISRNPIFFGMLCTLLGFFLVIPTAITFTVLVVGFVVIQIQVRLEEAFLLQMHEGDFKKYCDMTRRWL